MSDRAFTISFAISLGVHLTLVIGQFLSLNWFSAPRTRSPLEVIYDYEIAQQELRRLQEQLSRAKRDTVSSPSLSDLGERSQIRIPDRPSLTADRTLADLMPGRSSVVDLTNLVDASRGDPVLLSYFSAIREQIQQTANRRSWLTGETAEGLVYVSFILTSTGAVQGVTIISDQSVPAQTLWDVARRIVKTAAPFPPFPPSMAEPSKTVVVPLEFLLGSY
jgi:TonB family protein